MRESLFESLVGLIVVGVAAAFLVFSLNQRSEAAPKDSYTLSASFNKVDGVNVGSDVRMAGKKIGVVQAIDLDPKTYRAIVTFTVPNHMLAEGKPVEFRVPDDTTAQIASDGLLGGAFLSLNVGGSFDYLPPGGRVEFTQGSVDLLQVLKEFANGAGGGDTGGATGSETKP